MAAEAKASANIAQSQLQQDVRWLESYNAPVRQMNERVSAILKALKVANRTEAVIAAGALGLAPRENAK